MKLASHEISCLLDCKTSGGLAGDPAVDALWQAGGPHSGYRTSTVRRLLELGLLEHSVRTWQGLPNRHVVTLSALGLETLLERVPDHPLLNDVETNRSRWRVIG